MSVSHSSTLGSTSTPTATPSSLSPGPVCSRVERLFSLSLQASFLGGTYYLLRLSAPTGRGRSAPPPCLHCMLYAYTACCAHTPHKVLLFAPYYCSSIFVRVGIQGYRWAGYHVTCICLDASRGDAHLPLLRGGTLRVGFDRNRAPVNRTYHVIRQ